MHYCFPTGHTLMRLYCTLSEAPYRCAYFCVGWAGPMFSLFYIPWCGELPHCQQVPFILGTCTLRMRFSSQLPLMQLCPLRPSNKGAKKQRNKMKAFSAANFEGCESEMLSHAICNLWLQMRDTIISTASECLPVPPLYSTPNCSQWFSIQKLLYTAGILDWVA